MASEKPAGDYINISELACNLHAGRKIIATVVGITMLLAVIYLHVASFTYTIQTEVFPVQPSDTGASMGRLSGLASLAGIGVGAGGQPSPFQLYTEEIYSRDLADTLVKRQDLMKVIFARDWDSKTGRWREHASVLHSIAGLVKSTLGFPSSPWHAPDGAALQTYISDAITIEQSPTKPTITVVMHHKDPQFGVRFLTALHLMVDDKLRRRQLLQSTNYIRYLDQLLPTIAVAEYRTAIASILSDQEKQKMIASSDTPYSAQTLGPSFASPMPTSPNPKMILIGAFFAGLFLGIALVSLRPFFPALFAKVDRIPARVWRRHASDIGA